ncbi:neuroligin-4, Y-linked-like [Cryptotermes secundus]|nr:neuroligin-4, Y-linked-like [Cryptotermes secundus]
MAVQKTLWNTRTYVCSKQINAETSRSIAILLALYVLIGVVNLKSDAAATGSSSSAASSSSSATSSTSSTTLSSRTVRTKYGDVSGVIVTFDSRHLEPVEVFRGIPYASPPTGNLRFMPPVTGALWSGVKMAEHFGPVCPQKLPDISNETLALKRMPKGRVEYLKRLLPYLRNQSEDCLYLNIYAPAQGKGSQSN